MSIPAITGALAAVAELKRRCPSCQEEQAVSVEDKNRTVPCQYCGADLPPPPTATA